MIGTRVGIGARAGTSTGSTLAGGAMGGVKISGSGLLEFAKITQLDRKATIEVIAMEIRNPILFSLFTWNSLMMDIYSKFV